MKGFIEITITGIKQSNIKTPGGSYEWGTATSPTNNPSVVQVSNIVHFEDQNIVTVIDSFSVKESKEEIKALIEASNG